MPDASPAADSTRAYLLRLALAADYVESRNPYPNTLRFWHAQVFDPLQPLGEALWASDREGDWQLLATAGAELDLPPGYDSWQSVNQEAVRNRRVLRMGTATGNGAAHYAVPRERRTGAYQVLHLVARSTAPEEETSSFLEVSARLLALQDGTWWDLRGRRQSRPAELSTRQTAILELMQEGVTYRRIGSQLGFSESTVKQEAMRIFDFLGVRDRASAVRHASTHPARG